MTTHIRVFFQPELQLVKECLNIDIQGQDVLEAMYVCAVEFCNGIDTAETVQYSMHRCCIGRLQEG